MNIKNVYNTKKRHEILGKSLVTGKTPCYNKEELFTMVYNKMYFFYFLIFFFW